MCVVCSHACICLTGHERNFILFNTSTSIQKSVSLKANFVVNQTAFKIKIYGEMSEINSGLLVHQRQDF